MGTQDYRCIESFDLSPRTLSMATKKPKNDVPDEEELRLRAQLEAYLARKAAKTATAKAPKLAAKRGKAAAEHSAAVAATHIRTQGGAAFEGEVKAVRDVIGRDAIRIINKTIVNSEDAQHTQLALADYLRGLVEDLGIIPLADIEGGKEDAHRRPVQLRDIYEPLDLDFVLYGNQTLDAALRALREPESEAPTTGKSKRRRKGLSDQPDGDSQRRATALEALCSSQRTLTLLGPAGSGKSTLGAHVLLGLAQAWQDKGDAQALIGQAWTAGLLLPVRVVLRQFAEAHAHTQTPLHAGDLWNFIGQSLQRRGWGDAARAQAAMELLARQHGAMVLLDGLDECGPPERQQRVLRAVREFMLAAGPNSRFLLTARPTAFPQGTRPQDGLFALAELDERQIESFIQRWYAALAASRSQPAKQVEQRCQVLLNAYRRPYLLPLARNPLLLTLMAAISNTRRLPDDRVDLYEKAVELLLERWNRPDGQDTALHPTPESLGLPLRTLRTELERLAYQAHEASVGSDALSEIGEGQLERAFAARLRNDKNAASAVVDFIERRTGLLNGLGRRTDEPDAERRFAFAHRTFQEYLAACHLATFEAFAKRCRELADADPAHWRIVLQMAARRAAVERGASAAEALIGPRGPTDKRRSAPPGPDDWNRALLAGEMLMELGAAEVEGSATGQGTRERVREWLVAGLPKHPEEGGLPALGRALMGDVLARLGDPRFAAERFFLPADENLGFVQIADDPNFMIGTRKSDSKRVEAATGNAPADRELNQVATPTQEFWIGRYPVTVAQFATYLESTQREAQDADALRDPANRPVRHVTWYEALAYTEWLHETLVANAHELPAPLRQRFNTGWRISLPSELEWEKAARGGLAAKVFSWGDEPDVERGNIDMSGIGDTSTVGCFPPNELDLYDAIGNVWEWTRSLWGKDFDKPSFGYPYDANATVREDLEAGEDMLRLVRGGAWLNGPDDARCASRFRDLPRFRNGNLGFRVVLSAAPVFGTLASGNSGL